MKHSIIIGRVLFVLTVCCLVAADVEVKNDRVVIATEKGRIEIDRGVIVKMTNTLTGETYTAEPGDQGLTGLLWRNDPA